MSADERLLTALQEGDERCPDGRALARLGQLFRDSATLPRSPDLAARVVAVCADPAALAAVPDDDALVDRLYNGGADSGIDDAELLRLRQLIRDASRLEREPDLLPRLAEELAGTSDSARRSGVGRIDSDLSWRIWSVVVGGHVAALLVLTLLHGGFDRQETLTNLVASPPELGEGGYEVAVHRLRKLLDQADGSAATTALPDSWNDLADRPDDLFRLRQRESLRATARQLYGCSDSSITVARGLRWLELQQREDGFLGRSSGDRHIDLAAHSLATLALLGEGLDAASRSRAARTALDWLQQQQNLDGYFLPDGTRDGMVYGVAVLALVEGAALFDDAGLRTAAELACDRHRAELIRQAGAGGLNGFALLAIETARLHRFRLPDGLAAEAAAVAAQVPRHARDVGTVGLSLLNRAIRGDRDIDGFTRQATLIAQATTAVEGMSCDPLGWYFATLALREQNGPSWETWNRMLENRILAIFEYDAEGAWVAADRVRHARNAGAAGDVLATSICLLNLQVSYRYLPVRL
jgi:hypothetical protein